MVYSLSTTSPFLKGLNTELNKLVDTMEYTSDELNCMVRQNNTRSRRPGVDYEELYKFNNEYLDLSKPNLAFQCIEWTDINSPDEAETYTGYPYLVCQVGGKIIFFRNQGQPYSGNQESYVLDLASYRLDSTSDDYMTERCRFTAAYGCIFVTSKAIKPIYLRSAQDEVTPIVPPTIPPQGTCSCAVGFGRRCRLSGDGWAELFLNDIPLAYCNIRDYFGTPTLTGDGPYMVCSTQIADTWNKIPSATRMGITATPKFSNATPITWGIHDNVTGQNYTAGPGSVVDDYVTFTAPVSSGQTLKGTKISIRIVGVEINKGSFGKSDKTYTCSLVGGTDYQYKAGLGLTIRDTGVGAQDFLANDATPVKMSYAHLYNLLNQGWTVDLIGAYYNANNETFPGNNLAQQYLKDTKTEAFDPTAIVNMTLGNTPAPRGHFILNFFDQKRVTVSNLVASFRNLATKLGKQFNAIVDTGFPLTDPTQANNTDALSQVPDVKPRKPYVTDICAYAGRIFYLSGDVLLYSQVIAEDISKADRCYTDADPTSEEISDVIDTDGGLISLPEIGEGLKLQPCGDSLLVFGTRGTHLITGTANNIFTATAYNASAVHTVPTQSPDSFVSTEFGILYWGITGIQLIAQTSEGIQNRDLSTEKILTFFGKLSNLQHQYCKGVYSSSKKKVYWFYPGNPDKPRSLNLCLVYDIQRDAFTPQEVVSSGYLGDETEFKRETPEIVSGLQLKVPFKSYKEYPVTMAYEYPDPVPVFRCKRSKSVNSVPQRELDVRTDNLRYIDSSYLWKPRVNSYVVAKHGIDPNNFDLVTCITPGSSTLPGAGNSVVMEIFGATQSPGGTAHTSAAIKLMNRATDSKYKIRYLKGQYATITDTDYIFNSYDHIWFRFINTGTSAGYYYLKDSLWEYTLTTLPPLEEWTALVSLAEGEKVPPNVFSRVYKYPYIGATDAVVSTEVPLEKTADLKGAWSAVATVETGVYYYNLDVSNILYSDIGMTTQNGLIGTIIGGSRYYNTNIYDVSIQKEGADKVVAGKNWRSLRGLNKMVYMSMEDYDRFPSGTKTGPTVTGLFEDIECTISLTDVGYISYDAHVLDYVNTAPAYPALEERYYIHYTQDPTGEYAIVDDDGVKILADDPLDTEEFTYESSILLCLDPSNCKVTFGDFRNNYMRDWSASSQNGFGYTFDSYMISHPMNSQDFIRNKTMPYLYSYFKRTETGATKTGEYIYGSRCQGSVRWDWRTNGDHSKWDSPNELYRPNKKTLLSEGYIISKTNIRGLGRSFQVKLQGVEDKNFVVEALGFNLQKDERI